MKIFLGADHNGYHLKEKIEKYLQARGYDVVDEGDERLDPDDDFTIFAGRVVSAMKAEGQHARGILVCGSGQGMAIAANRHKGIRAGLGWSVEAVRDTRNDEDSNVLALPAEILKTDKAWQTVIDTWLETPFAGASRYKRRNRQLDE
ncbi:RpiB/LacA/LacB family sugar-phosphate isomerase [Candidatus Saccharibacteria bacterium]|nr:RpiB/LacA/LacB family sugar-phosphate isomerase [Candidatus Saccharibacteria bacterium]